MTIQNNYNHSLVRSSCFIPLMCHSLELTGKKVIPRLIAEQIYIFEKGSSTKSYNIDWLV